MNENQLLQHGIDTKKKVYWNLPAEELLNAATRNDEGKLTDSGALCCETGPHTGRSPGDRFIVKDIATADTVDWGAINQPMKPEHFAALRDFAKRTTSRTRSFMFAMLSLALIRQHRFLSG